jgi:DNA-directed RNA polymerase subunit RPC12/RpoP
MEARCPLDEDDKRRLVLKLVTRLRCIQCGQPFDPHDLALVDRQPDAWVLAIQCRQCGASSHVVVIMRSEPESELGVDLTPGELKIAEKWPPITSDDLLDVHQFLEEFSGDLNDLFSS